MVVAGDDTVPLDESTREHSAAFIFRPDDELDGPNRPAKRRKVAKKPNKNSVNGVQDVNAAGNPTQFLSLFHHTENEAAVRLRQDAFEKPWARVEARIQKVLRDANLTTLHEVVAYLKSAPETVPDGKIPAGFIITGPNMASQDLLFEQLGDSLKSEAGSIVVQLRSADVTNLRSTLTKIIQNATSKGSLDEEDLELTAAKDGRKFLKYDLEALHAHLKHAGRRDIVIVFQDSEGFDGGLLSDLISLLHSWLDRISFSLVFGVATSVDLFQARLMKSTCRSLHGAQFDVEQSASIVDRIFKVAISHVDAPIRLGASLVSGLLDRQRDQVASIPVLINSLKYLYMCHFYSNPLSIFLNSEVEDSTISPDHVEIIRGLASVRKAVSSLVDNGDLDQAKLLLEDDRCLCDKLTQEHQISLDWHASLLRRVQIMACIQEPVRNFTDIYLDAVSEGMSLEAEDSEILTSIKRLEPPQIISLITKLTSEMQNGDDTLGLSGWEHDEQATFESLGRILEKVKSLHDNAQESGHTLRSKYSSQNKMLRATVVAQKVQLSRDRAALTDEDKEYSDALDSLGALLQSFLDVKPAEEMAFHEIWLYDAKLPYRDVFIPKPRAIIERALSQPQDYLGSCGKPGSGHLSSKLPATAILYQLYLETGSLINVADLWSAYFAIVGEDTDGGLDERIALVLFYRALAEMKAMGFVKQTRKKADHIAKLAWKGL